MTDIIDVVEMDWRKIVLMRDHGTVKAKLQDAYLWGYGDDTCDAMRSLSRMYRRMAQQIEDMADECEDCRD